ncbi:alpha-L-rhamnosidase, partial [Streptomyces sp. SID3343]|uniref:alpha-L-rhamnosidase-related protein n=1 Tax=Streptomyces sp. SID3343 TaxID=2690260 RepID=UPI001369C3D9
GRGRELLDARALPADWQRADRDPGWPTAVLRRAMTTGEPGRPEPPSYPGGPFGGRPIAWPVPSDTVLTPGPDGAFAVDHVVSGTLVVDADGPPGAEVVVHTAEFAAPGEHDASLAVVTDGTRRVLESLDSYGLRGVVVEAPPGVIVHGVSVRERTYPVAGDAWFGCSDPVLERIWRVGRRTVTLCSADAYVDCPTREQRAWTGDAVVHQLVDLTTNTDWRLARWHPRLAASPRSDGMLPMAVAGDAEWADFTVIPDWALHWVHSVWNLYRYVGDRDEIAELLPVAERVVRWFLPFLDDSGVPTDVFGWVIIDWSAVHTEGVSAALCGLWGRALLEFAEMASWVGDEGRAGWARGVHTRLAEGFERLWDTERGRYADSIADGERRPMASQHGQAAAIVGGLAPRERYERLVRVLTDEDDLVHAAFSAPDAATEPGSDAEVGGAHLRAGPPKPWWDTGRQVVRAQPFFRYVVHDALAVAGRADLIAGLCRDWAALLPRSDTSWSETWYGGTVSHGWSSTPTRDLMTRVLGVEPAEPGFTTARIAPALGALAHAAGAVPTPAGLLTVDITPTLLTVNSPIPFTHAKHTYPPGHHTIPHEG